MLAITQEISIFIFGDNNCFYLNILNYKCLTQKCRYLFVKSSSLVAKDPKSITDIKYKEVVVSVAANVPIGIERCVSFSDAERFEPAIIPVTAGKKRPTNALTKRTIIHQKA